MNEFNNNQNIEIEKQKEQELKDYSEGYHFDKQSIREMSNADAVESYNKTGETANQLGESVNESNLPIEVKEELQNKIDDIFKEGNYDSILNDPSKIDTLETKLGELKEYAEQNGASEEVLNKIDSFSEACENRKEVLENDEFFNSYRETNNENASLNEGQRETIENNKEEIDYSEGHSFDKQSIREMSNADAVESYNKTGETANQLGESVNESNLPNEVKEELQNKIDDIFKEGNYDSVLNDPNKLDTLETKLTELKVYAEQNGAGEEVLKKIDGFSEACETRKEILDKDEFVNSYRETNNENIPLKEDQSGLPDNTKEGFLEGFKDEVSTLSKDFAEGFKDEVTTLTKDFAEGFKDEVTTLTKDFAEGFKDEVTTLTKDFAKDYTAEYEKLGKDFENGFIEGISPTESVEDFLKRQKEQYDEIKDKINDEIKDKLGVDPNLVDAVKDLGEGRLDSMFTYTMKKIDESNKD